MASEIKRPYETSTDAIKTLDEAFEHVVDNESMICEIGHGAIATESTQRAVEDFGHGHEGACAPRAARGQASMHTVLRIVTLPLRLAVDYALPPRCAGCGVVTPGDHLFCADCWPQLDFLAGPACASCGDPFPIDPGPEARCGACLADPPAIDGMRAAVAYGDIARRLALRLKHGRRPGIAVTLALQMNRLLAEGEADALLIPVPLHRWRLWQRGYNQAALIAGALSSQKGLQTSADLLQRIKATPILRKMGPHDRRKTVRSAFRVDTKRASEIAGRTIVLVDDVYTTGATANACARALKRAGAARVVVCCWARVVRDIDNGTT